MFTEVRAILFDLDGTLVDSVPDLTIAVDSMMLRLAFPKQGEDKVRNWVGDGAERLIQRALADAIGGRVSTKLLAQARPIFYDAYRQSLSNGSELYQGVSEGLEVLRNMGLPLACVTNKPLEFTEPLLQALGILDCFDVIVGGDCAANKKPAPDGLLMAARRLEVDIAKSLMVGDSVNDVLAAREAGCQVVCVPYGYNYGEDIRKAGPDRVVGSIAELGSLLSRSAA